MFIASVRRPEEGNDMVTAFPVPQASGPAPRIEAAVAAAREFAGDAKARPGMFAHVYSVAPFGLRPSSVASVVIARVALSAPGPCRVVMRNHLAMNVLCSRELVALGSRSPLATVALSWSMAPVKIPGCQQPGFTLVRTFLS